MAVFLAGAFLAGAFLAALLVFLAVPPVVFLAALLVFLAVLLDFFAAPPVVFFAALLDFLAVLLDFFAAPPVVFFAALLDFLAVLLDFFAAPPVVFFAALLDFLAALLDFFAAPPVVFFAALLVFAGAFFAVVFFVDEPVALPAAAFVAATAAAGALAALATVSFGSFFAPEMTFLRSWPAVNFGTAVFLAFMRSPVRGFRTQRASRMRFSNDPKPVIATFSPFATSRVIVSRTDSSAWAAALRFPS